MNRSAAARPRAAHGAQALRADGAWAPDAVLGRGLADFAEVVES